MLDQLYKRFNVPQNIELMFNPDFKLAEIGGRVEVAKFGIITKPSVKPATAIEVVLEKFVF